MRITRIQLRQLVRESYEGAREATDDEEEYFQHLRNVHRSQQPGQSVEERMRKLEAKVDAILDMMGEM